MRRAIMGMLLLGLAGSANAEISFPLSPQEAASYCRIFGSAVSKYQAMLSIGEPQSMAAKELLPLINSTKPSDFKVLFNTYRAAAAVSGLKDGEAPAVHRFTAVGACWAFANAYNAAVNIWKEAKRQCEREKMELEEDGWDL